ncbi:hypothetical protein N7495_005922 [Penicillium taxi]|uniref:uncharacterized protein n=1 Tax=Penicillium taxi TaxID=168475 RepID=UPI00254506A4|nr:uncharacterized protein N7495_005922 [Penicillium taxi]KAJ5894231.1 hypothetical protein N7495_005922 [Penicillium taxi]
MPFPILEDCGVDERVGTLLPIGIFEDKREQIAEDVVAINGYHIGIEAELLLRALNFEEDRDIPDLKTSAYMIAASYCDGAPNWVTGMHEEV